MIVPWMLVIRTV